MVSREMTHVRATTEWIRDYLPSPVGRVTDSHAF